MDELNEEDVMDLGLHVEEEHKWALDVVCGMEVDPDTTKYHTDYEDNTYYFCNQSCLTHFINNPTQYVA